MNKLMRVNNVSDELSKRKYVRVSFFTKPLSTAQISVDTMPIDPLITFPKKIKAKKVPDSKITMPIIFIVESKSNITNFDIYSDKKKIKKIDDIRYIKVGFVLNGINIKFRLIPTYGNWKIELNSKNLNKLLSLDGKVIYLQITTAVKLAENLNEPYKECYGIMVKSLDLNTSYSNNYNVSKSINL